MKDAKKVIAVDIDDVLSSQLEVLIDYSNSFLDKKFSKEDFMSPGEYWGYYEKAWRVKDGEGKLSFKEFLDKRFPLKQVVTPGVKDALKILKQNYALEVITSRGEGYEDITVEWLEQQVPGYFESVHFVHKWDVEGRKATKAIICQEIGAEYLIDDSFDHCLLASEVGVKCLLFGNFGWNVERILNDYITRVETWLDVLNYFQNEQ